MKITAASAAALGQVGLLLACGSSAVVAQSVPVTAPVASGSCSAPAGESCPAAATMSGCVTSVMHSSGLFPNTWGNDSMAVVRCRIHRMSHTSHVSSEQRISTVVHDGPSRPDPSSSTNMVAARLCCCLYVFALLLPALGVTHSRPILE